METAIAKINSYRDADSKHHQQNAAK